MAAAVQSHLDYPQEHRLSRIDLYYSRHRPKDYATFVWTLWLSAEVLLYI